MEKQLHTTTGHSVSELLEDCGNCRKMKDQELSLHLLSESLLSEQQKLRQVLDWAHTFLSGGSEVHLEFCKAESLMLADEEKKRSASAKHHPHVFFSAGCNTAYGGRGGEEESMEKVLKSHLGSYTQPSCFDDPHTPFSFSLGKDESTWQEKMQNMELLDATNKHTLRQENCRNVSSNDATCLIKETTLNINDSLKMLKLNSKTDARREKYEREVGTKKEVVEERTEDVRMVKKGLGTNKEHKSSLAFAKRNTSETEFEKTQGHVEKTSSLSRLKIPQTLTVYEQYQLCVDQLHHLRVRQRKETEPGRLVESPAREGQTSEQTTSNPEALKHLNKAGTKGVIAAEKHTKKRSLYIINKSQLNKKRAALHEHAKTKRCDIYRNKYQESIQGTAEGKTQTDDLINVSVEQEWTDDEDVTAVGKHPAACITKRGGLNVCGQHEGGVRGPKKKAEGRGASLRLGDKSRASLFSSTKNEILKRAQSSQVKGHTNRHTPEDQRKTTSACRDTQKCQLQTETHFDDRGASSPAVRSWQCEKTDNIHRPAGVVVSERWLCLPDEVWLSVLSLLPLTDLCRAMQVCRRLHTLAADHTLWRDVRIENSTLTERCFLCVGGRRPRSLSLYSCSGPSLSSWGLAKFFTLCRNSLEELQVTSCTGPGLHGDRMLPLIGQLCDHVTSVDVSWSGATDAGVKALSDCCPGLRLKSVVLNGCQLTDDPLIKLVTRHKESLCRLEVFGCQFLSPSCLQTVFKTCAGLQHLNIGQVPRVNADCLTVMTSQLNCLISLNLTGLQAVSDAAVDSLLQSCVKLQSLTLSSCPAVTDLTLHSISKYTPYIRDLDVSGCKAVTDEGVESLALGCRPLQQLDLSSTCTGNRGVTLLANYCSSHLQTVKLSFCHISMESILKLCRRCQRLKVLHLYGCARLPTIEDIRKVNTSLTVYPLH